MFIKDDIAQLHLLFYYSTICKKKPGTIMHQSFNSLLTILKWDITALVRKISAPKSASLRKQSITFSRSPTGTPTRLSLRASRRRRRTARWPRPRLPSRRNHCLGNEPRDRGPRARCFPRRRRNHRTHRSKYSRCRMNVQLPQWRET